MKRRSKGGINAASWFYGQSFTSGATLSQAKSLELALAETTAQLATCTTEAMAASVQGRIDDLRRQIAGAS